MLFNFNLCLVTPWTRAFFLGRSDSQEIDHYLFIYFYLFIYLKFIVRRFFDMLTQTNSVERKGDK
jgi:hypothetical protein